MKEFMDLTIIDTENFIAAMDKIIIDKKTNYKKEGE